MKKYDVTALGEMSIDFTFNGVSGQGNDVFEANPGSAPCNVLAMLQKLGKKTAFVGKVGNDAFGWKLKDALEEQGIDTAALKMDDAVYTTLAFVQTLLGGDRDFSFYRNPGADMMLTADEVDTDMIADSRIFHFGTLLMTDEGVEQATIRAVEAAKEKMIWGMRQCDAMKISDNEIEFITGTTDIDAGAAFIQDHYHVPFVCATLGPDGSRVYYKGRKVEAAPFLREDTIETTGAGDTFCACMIDAILEHGLDMSDEELRNMLVFANAAASIITTRKGSLRAMAEREEVEVFIASVEI